MRVKRRLRGLWYTVAVNKYGARRTTAGDKTREGGDPAQTPTTRWVSYCPDVSPSFCVEPGSLSRLFIVLL